LSEPYLSEIRLMSFDFPPKGWALCNGQFLPINQNQALFALLGTRFGGNGQTNFALPDLRGRVPIHQGRNHLGGERGGEEAHTLSLGELPTHTHTLYGSTQSGDTANPNFAGAGHLFAADPGNSYANALTPSSAALNAASVSGVGGSQPHSNMQPYLTLSFCISLLGIFPSPN
jgi:microcystin-dependent protein